MLKKPKSLKESIGNAKEIWDHFPQWKKDAFKIKEKSEDMNTIADKLATEIEKHLSEIHNLLAPGFNVTLLIRKDGLIDGHNDLIISNDNLDEAVIALRAGVENNKTTREKLLN